MAPNTLPAMAKSAANYANSALIKMEALADGYAEGIALDVSGNISEGSGQNIFMVRDGVHLHTAAGGVDPRRHHPRLGHDTGARSRLHGDRIIIPREALYIADEVFFVGDGGGSHTDPIDGQDMVGAGRRGPVTEALQRAFFDVINGEVPDTPRLADYVYVEVPAADSGQSGSGDRRHPARGVAPR